MTVPPALLEIARSLLAVAVAALLMLVVVAAFGYDPRVLGPALCEGAFGSGYRFAAVALLACPLCLLGLAVTLSFKTGTWNIGAEGQYLTGAAAAAAVGVHLPPASAWLAVPAVLFAGIAAGGVWSLLAGWLKVARGVQEVLSTILLNFIALRLIEYLVRGPLVDPESIDRDSTAAIAESARLATIMPRAGLHAGIVIAVVAAIALSVLLWRTTAGFRLRAVGANPIAARYAGIGVERWILVAFGLSGGLAGLAGAIEVAGTQHYLTTGFAAGYGYTAIAVALLARLSPMAVIPSALFFAAIDVGTRAMQKLPAAGLQDFPTVMKYVAQGVVVLVTLLLTRERK